MVWRNTKQMAPAEVFLAPGGMYRCRDGRVLNRFERGWLRARYLEGLELNKLEQQVIGVKKWGRKLMSPALRDAVYMQIFFLQPRPRVITAPRL